MSASNLTMCSFCGKSHAEVRKLNAGPCVTFCDNCINVCKGILDKELNADARRQTTSLRGPKSAEIRRQLDNISWARRQRKMCLRLRFTTHFKRIWRRTETFWSRFCDDPIGFSTGDSLDTVDRG